MDFIAMKGKENLKSSEAVLMEHIKAETLLLLQNSYWLLGFWLYSTAI